MTWEQIRATYPDRWVLMESLKSHIEGDRCVYEDLSVLDTADTNDGIFPRYSEYRKRYPGRDILFIHGSRVDPDVRFVNRFGAKVCRDAD